MSCGTTGKESKTQSNNIRLFFIRETKNRKRGYILSLWRCSCGGTKLASKTDVKFGKIKSCGCKIKRLGTDNSAFKHGKFGTPIHKTWDGMIQRCNNPKNKDYKNWGARGITVCKRWLDFQKFLEDMGDKPTGLSLGRIDNNKGYSKKNCRWETQIEQHNNKRNNVFYSMAGISMTLPQWARHFNITCAKMKTILKEKAEKL